MVETYLIIVARLILACILGGAIGHERESLHRPAGFRTHILVCVGAALVMVTSEFIFNEYGGMVNIDPARLGAQVISGIGFLGAGTIIREGFNVKGLTTAASLWAVSCVGIAAGIGFYGGAVIATILIYITLIVLRKIEDISTKKRLYSTINVEFENRNGLVGEVSSIFEKLDAAVKNIEFSRSEDEKTLHLRLVAKVPLDADNKIAAALHGLDGVKKVYKE